MTALARYDAAVASGTTIAGWRDIAAALDAEAARASDPHEPNAGMAATVQKVATLRDRATDARARADRMAAQQEGA